MTVCNQHNDEEIQAQIKETLESLLARIDLDQYPVVTATTSQSPFYNDSCTKVSVISPVKDEELSKSNDIVMLRNLEITPPPQLASPSPNLNNNNNNSNNSNSNNKTAASAQKRRASQRTLSEQSEEKEGGEGRSKRQRKQTELFQAQSDKKPSNPTSSSSSSRKRRPEPKPQIRLDEPKYCDVIFYEKGDHLAIRNEENTFYLCQMTESVRKVKPFVKIRWLDSGDNGKTYHLTSHYDQIPQKSIIMPVTLLKLKGDRRAKEQFAITDDIRNTVMERLKRSLNIPADE